MTRFRPGPQLNERVATRYAVPEAQRLAQQLADRVRANVPDAGMWITQQDERVRRTHVKADGQTIPDNLRYILDHPSDGSQELARAPGDEELSPGNRYGCRCIPVLLRGVIAEHVAASDVVVYGAKAVATVSVTFSRIVESEHPGPEDGGGGWLAQSVAEVATGVSRSR